MTCCQQLICALLRASADCSNYNNFVSLIGAPDICCMSLPPASRFPVSLHRVCPNKASAMKIIPPLPQNGVVIVV